MKDEVVQYNTDVAEITDGCTGAVKMAEAEKPVVYHFFCQ